MAVIAEVPKLVMVPPLCAEVVVTSNITSVVVIAGALLAAAGVFLQLVVKSRTENDINKRADSKRVFMY